MSAVFLSAVACGGSDSNPRAGETISRDAFVAAYRQLRVEGIRSPDTEISLLDRDRILADLALTEEDLLTFVDVWGTNGEVMKGIWEEVDSLMRQDRSVRSRGLDDEDYDPEEEDARRLGRGRG